MDDQEFKAKLIELLRAPEGRAAIMECMHRPPVRQRDGSWREPTPGHEAKEGDVVSFIRSRRAGDVYRIEGDRLWLRMEGGGMEIARAGDVEVIIPVEGAPPRAFPLAGSKQKTFHG